MSQSYYFSGDLQVPRLGNIKEWNVWKIYKVSREGQILSDAWEIGQNVGEFKIGKIS